jgi:hypothetical protein
MDMTIERRMSTAWRLARPWLADATSVKSADAFVGVAGSCGAGLVGSIQVHTRTAEGFLSTAEVQRP